MRSPRRRALRQGGGLRRLFALALVVYLAGLARVTLGPVSTPSTAVKETVTQVDRVAGPSEGSPKRTKNQRDVVDTAFNVLLFVPFGGLLLGLWPSLRWWAVVAAGAALSGAIELSQRWFFTWRSAQLSDLLTNTLGTAIGCLLALAVVRRGQWTALRRA